MRPSGTRTLGLALALATGCSAAPRDLGPFAIRLVLDRSAGCATQATCADYGMACGAVVLTRIIDLEAGDPAQVVDTRCSVLDPADDVCDLGEGAAFVVPPHRIRIEVAAWRPELVAPPGGAPRCPDGDTIFDPDGRLRTGLSPMPALAGSAEYDAGSESTEAEVPIACTQPAQLDEDACATVAQTLVTALVDDIETSDDLTDEQVGSVAVSVVEPETITVGSATVWTINAADATRLAFVPGPVPTFAAFINRALGEELCTLVIEPAPQATSALVCEPGEVSDTMRDVHGVLVPRETLDAVLELVGGEFPTDGLLIGRVIDHTDAPLAGVVVTPTTGNVAYLSSDRASVIGSETSSSGFFLSLDTPYGTGFTARHTGDGRREDGAPRAGLIRGQLTVLVIRMASPP
jgi:hypothetical protein